jgi:hypothetical protein
VTDRHRPRPAGASFECSDESLNTIHAIGLRTVDLCALDAYVDCPTREQRAWTGDSVVHQMVDFVSNPDWSMPVWHPQLATHVRPDGMLAMAAASDFAADDQMYLPDWSLHWIRSVRNIHQYTGDRELVAELLPIAERVLRWFESFLGPDDLLHDVTGWALSDWASVYMNGCSSLTNALWARGLRDFAEMSSWLGNEASAQWARARHDSVRRAFEVFWDEGRTRRVHRPHRRGLQASRGRTTSRSHGHRGRSRSRGSSVTGDRGHHRSPTIDPSFVRDGSAHRGR